MAPLCWDSVHGEDNPHNPATDAGLVHIVVGTHAILEKDVEFHKLGLAIIDEQHRFGVMQRLKLMKKGTYPDVLVMTATPSPRTLALTIYGTPTTSTLEAIQASTPSSASIEVRARFAGGFLRGATEIGAQGRK